MSLKLRRPEGSTRKAAEEWALKELGEDLQKQVQNKGVMKTSTLLKAGDGGESGGTGSNAGLYSPTDEQLAKINQLTKSAKGADQVACFDTLSCNDLVDRDDDRFTTQCVKDFAALQGDLSSVGKSFLVGHNHTSLPVGRIFDAGTTPRDGALFMTNSVYVPNTPQYQAYLENVDFGIYWAVSVGVMLGGTQCEVCKEPFRWHGGWCENFHEKGLYYDPNSDETDDFGWPEPVDPGQKGAVKCVQAMFEPRDFYELSQVYLGAQYFAAIDSKSALGGAVKGMKDAGQQLLGLGSEEARELPIPHVPEKVASARTKSNTVSEGDGTESWNDEQGLVWNYDPNTSQVTCLGKSNKEASDGELNGSAGPDADGRSGPGQAVGAQPGGQPDGAPGPGQEPDHAAAPGEVDGSVGGPPGQAVGTPTADQAKEATKMDKAAVLAAAKAVGVSPALLELAEADEGTGLEVVLRGLVGEAAALAPKAALGDAYVQELKADTIDWFVKAYQDGDTEKGVDATAVQQLLDACGDNLDAIKLLKGQYRDLAQAKFPSSTRRSAEPSENDGRVTTDPPETKHNDTEGRVSRIHG